jgi:hypothetical protein
MIYKNVCLHNIAELIPEEEGMLLSRIPDSLRTTLNDSAKKMALMPAGGELRFNLKSTEARIILKGSEEGTFILEVYQGNFFTANHFISNRVTEVKISFPDNIERLKEISRIKKLPFDGGLTRVILPYVSTLKVIDIQGEFQPPEKSQLPEKVYLAYGSSITHGGSATRPTGTYAMRTAQHLGADLINLGLAGGAHCESQMADYIAGRQDWDFASLEMGINMVLGFEVEEFKKRVEYFIPRIAEAHPEKYIFCIDMFTFYMDYDSSAEKQNIFREIVKNVVKGLNSSKVIYLDGREILKGIDGLRADLLHPSPAGMEEIALNLSGIIKRGCK